MFRSFTAGTRESLDSSRPRVEAKAGAKMVGREILAKVDCIGRTASRVASGSICN